MSPRDTVFSAVVAFLCLALAGLLLAADIAWPAMLSGYSGGGGSGASITPNSCTLPNVATGIDATGTLTCTQPSNVTGNAATATLATAATALAADPANCINANDFARGVLASGVAECAQPAFSNLSGTAAVTQGGTGLTTVAQGDLLYANAANSLLALGKSATATRYLANTGTSNSPAWDQVNLTNGVTGTLPVGKGGTGLSTVAQGAVLYASALDTVAGLAKSTTATRYLANTGASNAPNWDQVDLGTGITTTRLPMANIPSGGTASTFLRGDGSWATPTSGNPLDLQAWTTNGTYTWTKPSGANMVYVWCVGSGGGGGSGRRGSSTSSSGGGGGASGNVSEAWFRASELGATETVTIPDGGTGGAAQAGVADGNSGNSGSAASFGSWLTANGGNAGGGGTSASGASGPANSTGYPWLGRDGGIGSVNAGSTPVCNGMAPGLTIWSGFSPGSGGGGGGGRATGTLNGGDGGTGCLNGGAGGGGGATGSANGSAGTGYSTGKRLAGGGGGGAGSSSSANNGGTGGAGGAPGGGGGGGGGTISGGVGTSGAGGKGGAGGCLVVSY
jgi:hypothetical protein